MKLPPDVRLRADVGGLLEAAGESSGAEVLDPILIHLRLLARWNDAYGLTRITKWPEVLDRHVRESLLPLRWIAREQPGRLLDVGSGNGFPALPILACRPRLAGILLERSERKGLFLDAVIRECGWAGRVVVDPTDAESYEPGRGAGVARENATSAADVRKGAKRPNMSAADMMEPRGDLGDDDAQTGSLFEYVVSRATLAPQRYLNLVSRLVRPGGRAFLFAGELPVLPRGDRSTRLPQIARESIVGRSASFLYVFESPRHLEP